MYCIKCGEKIPEGAQFCPKCGNKVNSTDTNDSNDQMEGKNPSVEASSSEKLSYENETEPTEDGNEKIGRVDPDQVNALDRSETLQVLKEAEDILHGFESVYFKINELKEKIDQETEKGEKLREEVSPEGFRLQCIVLVAGIVIGFIAGVTSLNRHRFLGGLFVAAVFGVIALFIAAAIVGTIDVRMHKEENNEKADNYLKEQLPPLQKELKNLEDKSDSFGEDLRWVMSIVGKDMMYSGYVASLRQLIESHRADNLKEALLLYDEEQHKARMEQMQEAIQEASESSAEQAAQQTEIANQISKNTKRAATAASFTAVSAHNTSRHTKK